MQRGGYYLPVGRVRRGGLVLGLDGGLLVLVSHFLAGFLLWVLGKLGQSVTCFVLASLNIQTVEEFCLDLGSQFCQGLRSERLISYSQ